MGTARGRWVLGATVLGSANASVVIIEGVAAAQREVTHLLDAVVWVQSDFGEAMRRVLVRDGGDATARERHDARITEEIPFRAADRPWERATIIVAGTPDITHDPIREVVVAHGSMNNGRGSTERQQ